MMEISSSAPQNQALKSGEDQKTGKLDTQTTPEQVSTGVKKNETVMLSDQAQRIQKAGQDMAQRPVVDAQRVAEVREKLAQGLDILGNNSTSEASSLRIADKLLSIESDLQQLTSEANDE